MAQSDNARRTTTTDVVNAPKPQNSPGSNSSKAQLSKGDSSSWSLSSSLKLRRNHDDDSGNHPKKSVFSKVKEKARKLKKSISGRKHRDEMDLKSPNFSTPPGSAGPVKDDKQRPQFFSSPTPLQGSPVTADTNKQPLKEETNKGSSTTVSPTKNEPPPPAYSSPETASESTKTATSDANYLETTSDLKDITPGSPQPQDKGVSVTEYLMNKLEPGEDEQALSQAITETIIPKCEMVKEAVNSLLGNEETVSESSNLESDATAADSDSNVDTGARTSTESVGPKLTALTDHDPSNGPESRVSDASNISQDGPLLAKPISEPNSETVS